MKKWWVFIGLLLTYCQLRAQTLPFVKPVPNYSFAHFEHNAILYPGDSLAMERFFQKMDSVVFFGEGNVSIMHIGGSHVQAGVFTQQFRDNLLSIGSDLMGGQYFVFPFSTGGTNNPSHYIVRSTGNWTYCRNAVYRETDKRMGLAGAAITTDDSTATVSIMTREKHPNDLTPDFDFNKVTIVGFSETENVIPLVSYDGMNIQGHYDDRKSTYTFFLPNFTDSICILFDSVPGEFTLTGVLLENDMPGISVHGVGVNGASVPSYLRCDDFERDLDLIRPDLIIFGIGINDAAEKSFEKYSFKKNYDELIKVIKRVNPDCALLFMTNNDSYKKVKVKRKTRYEVNPNGKIVEDAFMEMGKQYNAAVWDQFDIMGGLKSMQDWEKADLAKKDKIHFTDEGYILLGDLLYNALITRYIEHIKLNAKR
jgi:lysophospholipase L1-like esterase